MEPINAKFYMIDRRFLLLLFCLGLSGCVNLKPKPDTIQHFALGPVQLADINADAIPLYVARPELPVYLDDRRLQYRDASGLVLSLADARWAETLEEGVARALSEYLAATQSVRVTGFYPWPPRSSFLSPVVRVRVLKFGVLATGEISMLAEWEVLEEAAVIAQGQYQSSDLFWDKATAISYVAGLNQALQNLSNEIVKSL